MAGKLFRLKPDGDPFGLISERNTYKNRASLQMHGGARAWKSFDWGAMDRSYQHYT